MKGTKVNKRLAALIPAAGSGTRLGLGAKAFVEVGGKTLLERSVAALRPHVDEVVVALPAGMTLKMPGVRVVTGGQTRQNTVRLLLEATSADVMLIHDAARPFLPAEVVQALLEAVRQTGAATAALPVADSLVRAQGPDQWGEVVSREGLWAVQTPQVFERPLIVQAHLQAQREGHAATDDAGLAARLGHTVSLVRGDARLFKVTTPGDLLLARALAAQWDAEKMLMVEG